MKVVPKEEKKCNLKGKPTRLDIVNYALEQTGFTSEEIMQTAIDGYLGGGGFLAYSNIDTSLDVIEEMYEKLEKEQIAKNQQKEDPTKSDSVTEIQKNQNFGTDNKPK